MDFTEIIKQFIITGGLIAVALISNKIFLWRSKKASKLESIDKLDDAIKKENNKWAVCEQFYQITNLRMNYKDICSIVKNDNVLILLHLLQKYKRLYEYKDGKLQYANEFKNKKVNFIQNFISKIGNWFFGIVLGLSIIAFSFSNTAQDKITFTIYILVIAPYFFMILTWGNDKRKAKELMI